MTSNAHLYYSPENFADFILQNQIVGFFNQPVLLASGKQSYWYLNWRKIGEDVFLIDQVANFLLSFVAQNHLTVDCFYGIPEGGTKLALITQYKMIMAKDRLLPDIRPLPMGRGKPKEHGPQESRLFLGAPQGRCYLIEDVVTTGGSLLKTIDELASIPDLTLAGVIVLSDRLEKNDDGQSVRDLVMAKNLSYFALSNALDLLPMAFIRYGNRELRTRLEAEMRATYQLPDHFSLEQQVWART